MLVNDQIKQGEKVMGDNKGNLAHKQSEKYGEYQDEFLVMGFLDYNDFYRGVWGYFCDLCNDHGEREWRDNFDDLLKEWDQKGRCKQHGFYHRENSEKLAHELYWFN